MSHTTPPPGPDTLQRAVETITRRYAGPGGAVAILRAGEVVVRHTWGFADAGKHIPFTPRTPFRICSITKQFTCAVLLDTVPDISELDAAVRARLPRLECAPPTTRQLCHNQSGLRDYWALAMLLGPGPEARFGDADARRVIASNRTLHFEPGTRYSYSNQNYRMLSDALEERSGRSFEELLNAHVFARAGMETAGVSADTGDALGGTKGYEGTPATGFRCAVNHIHWTGDAAISASLDDLIAWERYIDRTRDDAEGLYRRLSAPTTFADGAPATYGFGLARRTESGRTLTGHAGVLRGWRSHRLHAPAERISVVVFFNHMADASGAASDLMTAALGEEKPAVTGHPGAAKLAGAYVDSEYGLAMRLEAVGSDRLVLRVGAASEPLVVQADGSAVGASSRIEMTGNGLMLRRTHENYYASLRACTDAPSAELEGRYRSEELDAELQITRAGGVLYGAFIGPLGHSQMEQLDPVGSNVWVLPCRRSLDAPPPGEWTLLAEQTAKGRVVTLLVGCVLARRIRYSRLVS